MCACQCFRALTLAPSVRPFPPPCQAIAQNETQANASSAPTTPTPENPEQPQATPGALPQDRPLPTTHQEVPSSPTGPVKELFVLEEETPKDWKQRTLRKHSLFGFISYRYTPPPRHTSLPLSFSCSLQCILALPSVFTTIL